MSLLHPLPFAWPEAIPFWLIAAWLYVMEARQLQRKAKASGGYDGHDKYSGLVISMGSTVLQLIAVVLAFVYEPGFVGVELQHPIFYAGLAVTAAGTLLRMHCWKALGEFFTHTVTIASNHQVINIGAYRWLRHPAYLGAWLNLIGLGLALGNWASLALVAGGSFFLFLYRIHVEEAALETALGDAYRQFKLTRKRMIPFVY